MNVFTYLLGAKQALEAGEPLKAASLFEQAARLKQGQTREDLLNRAKEIKQQHQTRKEIVI
jgi:hypothetical protein